MTHQEIIALAKDAGLSFIPEANSPLVRIVMKAVEMERQRLASDVELPEPVANVSASSNGCIGFVKPDKSYYTADQLRDYGDRRAAAEQEAVTTLLHDYPHWLGNTAKKEISDAIRARTTP